MAKANAFMPLYVADYLADTTMLTRDQHGAYILLIMTYWRQRGPLPDNDEALAMATRSSPQDWKKLRPVMQSFFKVEGGLWKHKRIDAELVRADEQYTARVNASRKANTVRHGVRHGEQSDSETDTVTDTKRTSSGPPDGYRCGSQSPSPSPVSSVASQREASPPQGPLDLKAELFRRGVSYLKANGLSDQTARQMLGKWRKTHGDVAIINALAAAEGAAVSDPIPYISAALAGKGATHGNSKFGTSNLNGGRSIFAEIGDELAAREAGTGTRRGIEAD